MNNLFNKILLMIFSLILPKKITPFDKQYYQLKFVCVLWKDLLKLLLVKQGTKYYLVEYDLNTYEPPNILLIWNIEYDDNTIYLFFKEKKYEINDYIKENDLLYQLITPDLLSSYGKYDCDRCEKFTYCVRKEYFFKKEYQCLADFCSNHGDEGFIYNNQYYKDHKYSIASYCQEFKPQSYKIICKQPFDSTETFEFIRFYFSNHNEHKKVLDKIKNRQEELEEELNNIKLIKEGPEFLPIGEQKDDYVYIIQMDLCLLNKFINATDQRDLLLKFAELFGYLRPDFEIGYNTEGYDWNFVLQKSIILGIEEQFVDNLETTVRVVDKDIEEKIQKYEFAGININNRQIKKTFPTAISNKLDDVLVRCGLPGKINLPYVPDEETKDLNC
ncbi:4816_t:CDS:2, partial [Cetraspora pellucida]